MAWAFWTAALIIGYTYAGYPLLLWGWARLRRRPVSKAAITPTVSVVLAAHNEQAAMADKLENLLTLDYPADQLTILVGTDGCTDETDAIVARWAASDPRVRHYRLPQRVGKPAILNQLIPHAPGEIVILTDARQRFAPDAVRRLVEHFADPHVGAVSGELILTGEEVSLVGEGLGSYWSYEKFIRRHESACGSVVGATGAIYAIRRSLFRPMDPQTLLDDAAIPLSIIQQRYRTTFEPSALAFDRMSTSGPAEFRRKVRTMAGNYQLFVQFWRLLIPGSGLAWQFWSHKVARTSIPAWLAVLFVTSAILPGPWYQAAWLAQLAFYGLAALGAIAPSAPLIGRPARVAYVFVLLNASAVVGLIRHLRGDQPVAWERSHAA